MKACAEVAHAHDFSRITGISCSSKQNCTHTVHDERIFTELLRQSLTVMKFVSFNDVLGQRR